MKKIAVLGPRGTFSDCASIEYLKSIDAIIEKVYFNTIDETFHAVGKEANMGIIPVENTLDGYVQRTLDLLLEMDVHIISEIDVPVQFSLIGNVQKLEEIEKLYVQFKTSGQCRNFIDLLSDVKLCITESNMESYNKISENIQGEAAIIPIHMLECADTPLKIGNVTDSKNNYTRFIIVEPTKDNSEVILKDKIKAALYIMPQEDRPGILYDILKEFYNNNINLVSIMSRPTKKNMGTYNFYIELSGNIDEKDTILKTIDEIKVNYDVKLLGIYNYK